MLIDGLQIMAGALHIGQQTLFHQRFLVGKLLIKRALRQIPRISQFLHAWWKISRRIRVICVALNPYISLFSSFFTKKFIGIDSIIHVCNQTILLRCKTSTASSYSKKNTINALIDDAKIHENFQNLKSFRSFYHCFSLFNHHSHDAHVSLPNFDFHKKPMCNTSARHMPLI